MPSPHLLKTGVFSLIALAAAALPSPAQTPATPPVQHVHFTWFNFDSNIPGVASYNDAHAVNPRGIATDTKAGTLVADEGAGVLSAYDLPGPLAAGRPDRRHSHGAFGLRQRHRLADGRHPE